jgi:hypothetical protein
MGVGGSDAFPYDPRGCFAAGMEDMRRQRRQKIYSKPGDNPCNEQFLSETHEYIAGKDLGKVITKKEDTK